MSQAQLSGNNQQQPQPVGATNEVREILESKLGVEQIANFKPVEFRCMIQDILGNEIYNKHDDDLGDRTIYYCITIPGENEWVRTCPEGYKNEFMTNNGFGQHQQQQQQQNNNNNANSNHINQQQTLTQENNTSDSNESTLNTRLSFKLVNWSYPIPADGKNKSCLIKVYDIKLVDNLRVNDIVLVTGLVEPVEFEDDAQLLTNKTVSNNITHKEIDVSSGDNNNHDTDSDFEPASDFPHRLVPRVHVTTLKKLNHINPLLPDILTRDQIDINAVKLARSKLSSMLTQMLGGDSLAAEYLIMSLISRTQKRDLTTLGQFTIGLSGVKPQMNFLIEKLYEIIKKITTHSHFIDMSIANLNNLLFTPKKDHDNNKMIAGTFQLPEGLYLMLNETALSDGKLNAQGTQNLNTLNQIIRWQRHNYDFKFHSVEIDTDLKVFVVSEGKSILSIPYDVRLERNDPKAIESMRKACNSVDDFLSEDLLNTFRYFITALKDVPDYTIPEDVEKLIQEDFVTWRTQGGTNNDGVLFSADDLSSYLNLARYLTISRGETRLTHDLWKETCHMESTRKARLSAAK